MMRANCTTLQSEIAARLAAHLGHDALPFFAPAPPEPTDAECRELVNQYRDELAAQISARLEAEAVAAGTNRFWFQAAAQRDELREVVAHQRESIISLRARLTDVVSQAAANARAMETAAHFASRLRGLLLRVAACEAGAVPIELFGELQVLAVEVANDSEVTR